MHSKIEYRSTSKENKIALLVFFIIVTFFTLLMLNRGVYAMSQVASLILIVGGFFLDLNDLICLIAVILPTGNVFLIGGGNTTIPFLLMIYLIKSIIRSGGKFDIDTMKALMCIVTMISISLITINVYNISIMKIIPFYMHLVFIVFALRINHINAEDIYQRIALYFIVGTILVCVGTVFFPNVSKSLGNANAYLHENAGFSSTWDFGRSLTISIAFLMVDILKTRKRFVLDAALILGLLYFVVQSGRFSMLIGLAAPFVLLPFVLGRDRPMRQRMCYLLIGIIVIAGVGYVLFELVYMPMTALRGTAASDNGRFDIWKMYLEYLNDNILIAIFGVGGGAISSFANMLGTATAHNLLLEKVAEVGVVGLILLTMLFISLYRGKNISPFNNINILPLVAFLGTALTQGTSGSVAFALLLAMCASEKRRIHTLYAK